jgi:hypothetical protein
MNEGEQDVDETYVGKKQSVGQTKKLKGFNGTLRGGKPLGYVEKRVSLYTIQVI